MKALRYRLQLIEPLLITQPHKGEANSAISASFIPGSVIRGVMVRAVRDQKCSDIVKAGTDERNLFFDKVCYLHAYPEHPSKPNFRLLPIPKSWFIAKDKLNEESGDTTDFAHFEPASENEHKEDLSEADKPLDRPKAPKGEFCSIDSTLGADLFKSKRQITVHNASLDRNQKPRGRSQVFRYEALAHSQVMVGLILSDDVELLNRLHQAFKDYPSLPLGGSHNSGYGLVDVLESELIEDWQREYERSEEVAVGKTVTLTLLSDMLVRNQHGHFETDLAKVFADFEVDKKFQSHELVGGFNRHWGLQLPQHYSIAAGSVITLKNLSESQVRDLNGYEQYGLGDRRAEGFGRIALNWHTRAKLPFRKAKQLAAGSSSTINSTPFTTQVLTQMGERMLRKRLDSELLHLIKTEGKPDEDAFENLPSKSQLSRVRMAARRAIVTSDGSLVSAHLDSLQSAKSYWRRAVIGKTDFRDWLKTTSSLNKDEFNLKFGLTNQPFVVGDTVIDVSPELAVEYSNRLVEAVVKIALEKKNEQSAGKGGRGEQN